MRHRAAVAFMVFAVCAGGLNAGGARGQMTLPDESDTKPDGATLFANQCGTCHTVEHGAAPRQGPNLAGVYGRHAGIFPGFAYSAGFAQADWVWDEAHLDMWLTRPQAMIPSAVMLYAQADPTVRKTIIDWLKEQH